MTFTISPDFPLTPFSYKPPWSFLSKLAGSLAEAPKVRCDRLRSDFRRDRRIGRDGGRMVWVMGGFSWRGERKSKRVRAWNVRKSQTRQKSLCQALLPPDIPYSRDTVLSWDIWDLPILPRLFAKPLKVPRYPANIAYMKINEEQYSLLLNQILCLEYSAVVL